MSEDVIVVRGLVKKYEGRPAILDGLDFSIGEREFAVVCGKSGCGKTTLLNILGGLDRPTEGAILLDGEDLVGATEDHLAKLRLHKIGFVFQDYNLLQELTIRENIALPLRLSGKTDARKVDDLLDTFGLTEIQGAYPNTLSGGESQRVAVSRALMNNPRVVLADEPTGNLDSDNAGKVIQALDLARDKYGATVVLATHDSSLVNHSTKTIQLECGKATIGN